MSRMITFIGFNSNFRETLIPVLPAEISVKVYEVDVLLALEDLQNAVPEMYVLSEQNLGEQIVKDVISSIHSVHEIPILILGQASASNSSKKVFRLSETEISTASLVNMIEIIHSYEIQQKTVKDELQMHQMQVEELSETNAHLITATFRERSLKKELESSKALIEEQSKKITDSINYSLRIQQSIIPSSDVFDQGLGEHFVYYKPKDIVSGDFPWMISRNQYVYFAAVDCTGHGVPGAMMSMIGNLLLNSIVNNGNTCKSPADILIELHRSVITTLKQDAEGNKAADGMDAALCRLNFSTGELVFSGAHLPLFLVRNGELETFKGDKFPVGGMQYRNRNNYTDQLIQLESGDRIFIFSDGIIDQIGGPEKMKWMSTSLKDFLVANDSHTMAEIKSEIHKVFMEYKGDNKQVDDVLLIGVQYP